jgi:hypothetical protein
MVGKGPSVNRNGDRCEQGSVGCLAGESNEEFLDEVGKKGKVKAILSDLDGDY